MNKKIINRSKFLSKYIDEEKVIELFQKEFVKHDPVSTISFNYIHSNNTVKSITEFSSIFHNLTSVNFKKITENIDSIMVTVMFNQYFKIIFEDKKESEVYNVEVETLYTIVVDGNDVVDFELTDFKMI